MLSIVDKDILDIFNYHKLEDNSIYVNDLSATCKKYALSFRVMSIVETNNIKCVLF